MTLHVTVLPLHHLAPQRLFGRFETGGPTAQDAIQDLLQRLPASEGFRVEAFIIDKVIAHELHQFVLFPANAAYVGALA